MATTPVQLSAPTVIATTVGTHYTVPTGKTAVISKMTFYNTNAAAKYVTFHFIPSGGTASDTNTIFFRHVIETEETWTPSDVSGHVLPAGSFIQALAESATSVFLTISGTEVT